ncbi:hypothetical protein E5A73_20425 [Sphingomonas gei]|uniref:HEPN AbiU2-like domain-containing protein n=1 Tax=Sphingomonas gei TaxID=1395960 RepID=A0A4S1X0K8_9SPHN|nr:hypothetical protein [Sphingomonas gei]TGX49203.1 hypothetical protein E5A73_20425 [Sphingomonas gei]
MKAALQANYEARLSHYATLLHATEPPGLVAKLAVYRQLLRQREIHGEKLWKIEPTLYLLMHSAEIDLHLAAARLLEDPGRSEGSIFAFIKFCVTNRAHLTWKAGTPPAEIFGEQLARLEGHRATITAIMGRRDRFFAHLDKRYFRDPGRIYVDFPLEEEAVIALVNAVIAVITEHQWKLKETASFHLAEFVEIGVDNMVRNLEAGRRQNFPGQLE